MPLRRNRARKEVQPKEEPFSFAQVPEYSKPRPVAKHATEVVVVGWLWCIGFGQAAWLASQALVHGRWAQQSHLNLEKLATGPLRRYKSFLEFYHDMFEHINVVLCAMGS